MPQLDLLSFFSQFVWFTIGFWALYVVSFRYFLVPTSLALKIREYLFFRPASSETSNSLENHSAFSTITVTPFNKFISLYGNFLSKHASDSQDRLISSFETANQNSRSFISKSTQSKALYFSLKKACYYRSINN